MGTKKVDMVLAKELEDVALMTEDSELLECGAGVSEDSANTEESVKAALKKMQEVIDRTSAKGFNRTMKKLNKKPEVEELLYTKDMGQEERAVISRVWQCYNLISDISDRLEVLLIDYRLPPAQWKFVNHCLVVNAFIRVDLERRMQECKKEGNTLAKAAQLAICCEDYATIARWVDATLRLPYYCWEKTPLDYLMGVLGVELAA
jgi:hypothetical protein